LQWVGRIQHDHAGNPAGRKAIGQPEEGHGTESTGEARLGRASPSESGKRIMLPGGVGVPVSSAQLGVTLRQHIEQSVGKLPESPPQLVIDSIVIDHTREVIILLKMISLDLGHDLVPENLFSVAFDNV
jgi:hypothetical protein